MSYFTLFLLAAFGSPQSLYTVRAARGIEAMCPCRAADVKCPARQNEAARAIGLVAAEDPDPDDALARLVGTGAHESGFMTVHQLAGGPARSYWQLEATAFSPAWTPAETKVARATESALYATSPVVAARVALRRARTCRGSMRAYSFGRCQDGSPEQERVAAELRRYVKSARRATR